MECFARILGRFFKTVFWYLMLFLSTAALSHNAVLPNLCPA